MKDNKFELKRISVLDKQCNSVYIFSNSDCISLFQYIIIYWNSDFAFIILIKDKFTNVFELNHFYVIIKNCIILIILFEILNVKYRNMLCMLKIGET